MPKQHLHGFRKACVEIFLHEVNGFAARIFILVEPGVAAYGDMVIDPFQLRAGALQLFTAGFEEGGKVGVLGGVELGAGEGDEIRRCNHFQSVL